MLKKYYQTKELREFLQFNYKMTKLAVDLIGDKCETESSGGITENTIINMLNGGNYISLSFNKFINNFDLSLKAIKN